MFGDLFLIYDKGKEFFDNPGLESGFILGFVALLALLLLGRFLYRYFWKEEIKFSKQRDEVLEGLVASGFNSIAVRSLGQIVRLCREGSPKEFYDYTVLNKKRMQFFHRYPAIFKEVSKDKNLFKGKNLKESKDIFGQLWWIGINLHDLTNQAVLNHLDGALLMSRGEEDLSKVGFYFEELQRKAVIIDNIFKKLVETKEYKKIIKKKIFKEV